MVTLKKSNFDKKSIFFFVSECIDEEIFYNFYEEISDSPSPTTLPQIGILRTPDLKLLSNDNDSMIPRPKLGWPIRKVTFGKWKISFQFE